MSRRRKKRKSTFLPRRGEGSDNPDADFLIAGISGILGVIWDAFVLIAKPLWALFMYPFDSWVAREQPDKVERSEEDAKARNQPSGAAEKTAHKHL
jgi:hypothetical protein